MVLENDNFQYAVVVENLVRSADLLPSFVVCPPSARYSGIDRGQSSDMASYSCCTVRWERNGDIAPMVLVQASGQYSHCLQVVGRTTAPGKSH